MFIDGKLVDVKAYTEWVKDHIDDPEVTSWFLSHPGKTSIDAYQALVVVDVQKKIEVFR